MWDDQTRQDSAFEVCLNFIPERGNARLYYSGKPGICEPCLRIRYINSISLRLSFYPGMIRYLELDLSHESREVHSDSLCNWLKISQYGCFIEYTESFRDGSIRCASNCYASNNLNQSWRFRRTWKNRSRSQISLTQCHTDNIQWKCAVSTDSHKRIYGTAQFDLVHHQIGAPAFHRILVYPIQAMIQFTRCLYSIDLIPYSSQ
jgi:hypothetical protein